MSARDPAILCDELKKQVSSIISLLLKPPTSGSSLASEETVVEELAANFSRTTKELELAFDSIIYKSLRAGSPQILVKEIEAVEKEIRLKDELIAKHSANLERWRRTLQEVIRSSAVAESTDLPS